MRALLRVFWDIALLRQGPRDLPASLPMLGAVALAYFLSSLLFFRLMLGPEHVLARSLLDFGALVGAFSALLMLRGREHRLVQTLLALLGTGVLIAVPQLLIALGVSADRPGQPLLPLFQLANLALLVWSIAVMGHIVRAALDVALFTGIAVAISYFAVLLMLAQYLLPAPAR